MEPTRLEEHPVPGEQAGAVGCFVSAREQSVGTGLTGKAALRPCVRHGTTEGGRHPQPVALAQAHAAQLLESSAEAATGVVATLSTEEIDDVEADGGNEARRPLFPFGRRP